MFECKNCGAHELENGMCAYCKTVYKKKTINEPTIPSVLPETCVGEYSTKYKIIVTAYCVAIMTLVFMLILK